MLTDVQAVLFDLDGTLLDRRQSFDAFVREQWARFADVLGHVDREQYVRAAILRDADGYAPRRELFTSVMSQFALPDGLGMKLLADYRAKFPASCVLFSDAAGTLTALRASGFKLGLITNGSLRMQSRKIERLGVGQMFDAIAISDAEGVSKPDPRIFHLTLQRLNIAPVHAIYVGDRPDVDVGGARAAGLRAVWRRDPAMSPAVEADAEVGAMADLLPLLGIG